MISVNGFIVLKIAAILHFANTDQNIALGDLTMTPQQRQMLLPG